MSRHSFAPIGVRRLFSMSIEHATADDIADHWHLVQVLAGSLTRAKPGAPHPHPSRLLDGGLAERVRHELRKRRQLTAAALGGAA